MPHSLYTIFSAGKRKKNDRPSHFFTTSQASPAPVHSTPHSRSHDHTEPTRRAHIHQRAHRTHEGSDTADMGVYTPHGRAGRMKGGTRQTWVYIHHLNTLVINGYRRLSMRCIYTAHIHSGSTCIVSSPQGVYTPLIGYGLRRSMRPQRRKKISALGVYTPKGLTFLHVPRRLAEPGRLLIDNRHT